MEQFLIFAAIVLGLLLIICFYNLCKLSKENDELGDELLEKSDKVIGLRTDNSKLQRDLSMVQANEKEAKRNEQNAEQELANALDEFKEERNALLNDIEERDQIIDANAKEITKLKADLKQAQKNDTPKDPKTGKFTKKKPAAKKPAAKKTTTKKAAKKK